MQFKIRNLILLMICEIASMFTAAADAAAAAPVDDLTSAVRIEQLYNAIHSNIVYTTANNYEAKLDIYSTAKPGKPRPTLLYIHGGGWMGGFNKEMVAVEFLPFLQIGWNVINVDYRPSSVSLAPAAIEDCLCALRWVERNAEAYNIDTRQIVLMGHSAGAHLALMTGLVPLGKTGLGAPCELSDMYGPPPEMVQKSSTFPKPAAIINWYGITDVADLIQGPNQQPYAVLWIGNQFDPMQIAKIASPLNYVVPGVPPIITVHGDKDPLVSYNQAVRLHAALTSAHVTNKLITVPNGLHGRFGVAMTRDAWTQIFDFLDKLGLNMKPD